MVKCIYEAVIAMHTCRKWSRHDGWCLLRRNFYAASSAFHDAALPYRSTST